MPPYQCPRLKVNAAALRGGPAARIPLPHAVERIDLLGDDWMVVGNPMRR